MTKDEKAKEEIILQAQKLFQQYGLKKTTMDEIAAACGKAKSTLYHYYKSKQEVFQEVIQKEMINLRKHVKVLVDSKNTLSEKLKSYILEYHKEIVNKANIYRLVSVELFRDPANDEFFEQVLKYEKSYVMRILEDGYDTGELNFIEKEDIGFVAEVFVVAFLGIVKYNVEKSGVFEEDKLEKVANILISRVFIS